MNASGFGPVPPIDFTAPVYAGPSRLPAALPRTRQDWSRVGLYAQDQMRLDHWAVTVGGRQDWSLLDTANRLTAGSSRQDDQAFTGRVGAVYLFDSGLRRMRATRRRSSRPWAPVFGAPFKPTHARQTEAGVKYQPPGLDSFVAVSGFDITQDNVAAADPAHPFYSVQTGAVRSRGIEFEARATLSDSLDLIGAYTYLDTTVRRDSNRRSSASASSPCPTSWCRSGRITGFRAGRSRASASPAGSASSAGAPAIRPTVFPCRP